ncbi:unnamed protein product [Fraxinus pennsylvanica]|uniref:Uncharacterized protein n=1 Tax=Fraxinus pennsylvanica TaxID=56036 RepID=A0AAD1ZIT4_9LAMI|nr:unnamed protein product [Fraxinus pennsylvanica]
MSFSLDSVEQLNIPEVVFYTTSACGFMGYLHYGELVARGYVPLTECISEGVLMICWPFFAEQQTNCRYACPKWEIGLEIEGDVTREKVAKLVKILMEGEKGKEMGKKALEWKEKARLAAKPGGSLPEFGVFD